MLIPLGNSTSLPDGSKRGASFSGAIFFAKIVDFVQQIPATIFRSAPVRSSRSLEPMNFTTRSARVVCAKVVTIFPQLRVKDACEVIDDES